MKIYITSLSEFILLMIFVTILKMFFMVLNKGKHTYSFVLFLSYHYSCLVLVMSMLLYHKAHNCLWVFSCCPFVLFFVHGCLSMLHFGEWFVCLFVWFSEMFAFLVWLDFSVLCASFKVWAYVRIVFWSLDWQGVFSCLCKVFWVLLFASFSASPTFILVFYVVVFNYCIIMVVFCYIFLVYFLSHYVNSWFRIHDSCHSKSDILNFWWVLKIMTILAKTTVPFFVYAS